jgi:hypothetical protein
MQTQVLLSVNLFRKSFRLLDNVENFTICGMSVMIFTETIYIEADEKHSAANGNERPLMPLFLVEKW